MLAVAIYVVFGVVAGWVTALLARPNRPGDTPFYILVGVAGALIGGVFARHFVGYGFNDSSGGPLAIVLLCSFVVLALGHTLRRRA